MTTLARIVLMFAALIVNTAIAKADVVLDWNEIMLDTLSGQPPANETRLAAITQLAVFEAVNAVTREYHPYLGTVDAQNGASVEAAAVAAAHATLLNYVPDKAATLEEARAASLATILDGPAKDAGIAAGEAAAEAMTELRLNDGAEPPEFFLPEGSRPGVWQLTPLCPPQGGAALNWRELTPFGMESGSQFRAAPPPRLRSGEYRKDYNELRRVGGADSAARPQDRADVARFYAAVLGTRTWNPVATQVAAAQGRSLTENARALALLNMALSDALVAVFDSKYRYTFWRPETAIREGGSDGNRKTKADPEFVPFIDTPCHPSYPSAHASGAYAAVTLLERLFGRSNHFITLSSPAVPDVVLQYSRFKDIARDIDDARIYGGIHFRFDQKAGARQGRRLGSYIYRHNLRPLYRRHSGDEARAAQTAAGPEQHRLLPSG